VETEDVFLAAIHANPGDELTWQALADWLEERGDPRAELLRLSRALLRPPLRGWQRQAREQRLRELLAGGVRPCVPVLTSSIGLRLALIPAGRFRMGSPLTEKGRGTDEGPRHEVEITRPFYLGVFPVMQEQYERVTGKNPSRFAGNPGHPVEMVSWRDARGFCTRLSGRPEERGHKRTYRLPTEAEWEYACRAGVCSSPFHFGASLSTEQANFDGCYGKRGPARGAYLQRTSEVGSYPPNAFGLHDMHGNVWEWCQDRYREDSYQGSETKDPQGPAQGTHRVMRGGCWDGLATACRAAYRVNDLPGYREHYLGFRVALAWR
jgi:uncharacterized protein (TIGR02996 family)